MVPKDHSEQEATELGSDMAAGLVAGGLGLLTGPAGAVVGAFAQPALSRTIQWGIGEFRRRVLAPREDARVASVVVLASRKCQANLSAGRTLRQDGFFDPAANDRAAAEEVLEGVLLAAQREHEEKKLPFIGNLLANLAFDPTVDRAGANWLVSQAERLTYRQLCLLGSVGYLDGEYPPLTSRAPIDREEALEVPFIPEFADLYLHGLLSAERSGFRSPGRQGFASVGTDSVSLLGDGTVLFRLMELWSLPEPDLANAADAWASRISILLPGFAGPEMETIMREFARALE